jgi:hypothetical protein
MNVIVYAIDNGSAIFCAWLPIEQLNKCLCHMEKKYKEILLSQFEKHCCK